MGDVLLRRGALGDVVLLGAVTASAPTPVTVVTDARYVPLAARLHGVARALPWPDGAAGLPRGRRVDLQGTLGRGVGEVDARLRKRSVRRRLRLVSNWVSPRPTVPEIYAEACGWAPAAPPWFPDAGLQRDGLILIPGASTPIKRWAESGWEEVGRRWDGPVWVLGGPGEQRLVDRVCARLPGSHGVCERGFERTLEVLQRGRVAVGGDTGLMHLAGAMGVKLVALFGPTAPEDGFFVYPGEVVQRSLRCRPCTLHRRTRCWRGGHPCMDLPAEHVAEAVRRCAG